MGTIDLDAKLSRRGSVAVMSICAALWSTSGALIKYVSFSALTLAGLRSLLAGAALWGFLAVMKRRVVLSRVTCLAAVAVCIKYISFVTATRLTSGANAVAAQYTSPVFVLIIMSVMFRKRPRPGDIMVSAATFAGIALMLVEGFETGGFVGDMLGLLCGVMTAIMYIVTSRLARFEETMSVTILGHALVFIVCSPFIALYPPQMTRGNVLGILMLGLFQQAAAYILYSFAIRSASPVTCSIIGCIDPVLSPIWIALLVGEIPGAMSIAGFLVVISSITVWLVADALALAKTQKQSA
jgi:drug/metabolite transporter (DMT)-like permease